MLIIKANKDLMRKLAADIRSKKGLILFEKVKGHAGIAGNKEADRLARDGVRKPMPDTLDMET